MPKYNLQLNVADTSSTPDGCHEAIILYNLYEIYLTEIYFNSTVTHSEFLITWCKLNKQFKC